MQIVEPPKYDYPHIDNIITVNNNDNSNVINLSKTLAVVSSIKLPESVIMTTVPSKNPLDAKINDKQKITHVKPNFIFPKRNNIPINSTTRHTFENKQNVDMNKNSNGIKVNNATCVSALLISKQQQPQQEQTKPTTALLGEIHSSIPPKISIITTTTPSNLLNQMKLPPSSKPLSNGYHSSQSTKINTQIDKIPTILNALKVDVVQSENNNKQNNITDSLVANKKALFEKKSLNETVPSMSIKQTKSIKAKSSHIGNTMNRLRNKCVTEQSTQSNGHLINMNYSNNNTHTSTSSFNVMRNKFCQDQTQSVNANNTALKKNHNFGNNTNKIVTNGNNASNVSEDLQDAPNRYPEKIHLTKTITTTERYVHQTETVFSNLRFSIDDQAHVVPKLKLK